jgi:cystathionine beta-lyase/cystathionine gamma-synthase
VHSSTYAFEHLNAMNAQKDLHADSAYYQRHGHPTVRACERSIARLAGAEDALLFASGMAAIASVFMAHLHAGDHAVVLHQCYGGTHGLLHWGKERSGWTYDLVDARNPDDWAKAFKPNTRFLHVETPTNPTLQVVDIAAAASIAHAHGAKLFVDNTAATVLGQDALALGADVVVFSATKATAGHSDLLAGAAAGPVTGMGDVWQVRSVMGPNPAPEVAWQLERSMKTLAVRLEAANANALELARRLNGHDDVAETLYPGLESHPRHDVAVRQMRHGFGPLLSFDVRSGAQGAEAFVNALTLVKHATSFGGVESMASLPAHTSHVQLGAEGRRAAGIPDGLVRFSCGIEDVEDVWSDIEQALAAAVGAADRAQP